MSTKHSNLVLFAVLRRSAIYILLGLMICSGALIAQESPLAGEQVRGEMNSSALHWVSLGFSRDYTKFAYISYGVSNDFRRRQSNYFATLYLLEVSGNEENTILSKSLEKVQPLQDYQDTKHIMLALLQEEQLLLQDYQIEPTLQGQLLRGKELLVSEPEPAQQQDTQEAMQGDAMLPDGSAKQAENSPELPLFDVAIDELSMEKQQEAQQQSVSVFYEPKHNMMIQVSQPKIQGESMQSLLISMDDQAFPQPYRLNQKIQVPEKFRVLPDTQLSSYLEKLISSPDGKHILLLFATKKADNNSMTLSDASSRPLASPEKAKTLAKIIAQDTDVNDIYAYNIMAVRIW